VEAITPAVEEAALDGVPESELLTAAVTHNVERVVQALRRAPVISAALRTGDADVVGAVYHLGTGEVEFL